MKPPDVAAAQERLDAVREAFEKTHTVYPLIGNHALAPTGEEYMTVAGERVDHPEGGRSPLYATADQAIAGFVKGMGFFNGIPGTLFWRILPEIDCLDEYDARYWKTYCRLLISEKPVIMPACYTAEEIAYRCARQKWSAERKEFVPCIPTTNTASIT